MFMNECIDSTMGRIPRMLAEWLASDDPRTSWSFQYPSVERKKIDFWKTIQGRGGPKQPHVPSTKTAPLVTALQLPPSHPYYERVTPRLGKEGGVGKFRKISIPILK